MTRGTRRIAKVSVFTSTYTVLDVYYLHFLQFILCATRVGNWAL